MVAPLEPRWRKIQPFKATDVEERFATILQEAP